MINPFDIILARLDQIEQVINGKPQEQAIKAAEIIDRAELCRRLNVSEPTVIRWERKGKIPFFRIGSSVRYNWITVVDQLEKEKK